MYNFDKVTKRFDTDCVKWDAIKDHGYDSDLIPMWVADMDFEVLPEITEALQKRISHPIYGYSKQPTHYFDAVAGWFKRRHNFILEEDWLVTTPGVVTALKIAVNAYTKPGDAIIIQKPVYHPFDFSIDLNDRVKICNPMILKNNHYEIDFEDFERKIEENNVKMFILCNPSNPIGKVWTQEELFKIGQICKSHDVIVVADEIHADFTYKPHQHIPFYNVDPSFKDFSIIATAPSKTFNLAGLQTSNIFIANETLRKQFIECKNKYGINDPNFLGLIACEAAYTHGDLWVDEMLDYLKGNIQIMKDFFHQNFPSIQIIEPEGLYLVWIDFSSLNMSCNELEHFMLYNAKLWLDEGYIFGEGGECFERFNIATSKTTLLKALNQLKEAILHLKKPEF